MVKSSSAHKARRQNELASLQKPELAATITILALVLRRKTNLNQRAAKPRHSCRGYKAERCGGRLDAALSVRFWLPAVDQLTKRRQPAVFFDLLPVVFAQTD